MISSALIPKQHSATLFQQHSTELEPLTWLLLSWRYPLVQPLLRVHWVLKNRLQRSLQSQKLSSALSPSPLPPSFFWHLQALWFFRASPLLSGKWWLQGMSCGWVEKGTWDSLQPLSLLHQTGSFVPLCSAHTQELFECCCGCTWNVWKSLSYWVGWKQFTQEDRHCVVSRQSLFQWEKEGVIWNNVPYLLIRIDVFSPVCLSLHISCWICSAVPNKHSFFCLSIPHSMIPEWVCLDDWEEYFLHSG